VSDLPSVEKSNPAGTAFMDKAFGVGKSGGPGQDPSYTLGLARIMHQFKAKQFEYTLIEINNLLGFYPNSPKLHKMKGTIYIKLRNYTLAERSWIRALELDPQDRVLKESLARLQQKIKVRTATDAPAISTPEPTQTSLEAP
jgi:predicted Zn-dependent protease